MIEKCKRFNDKLIEKIKNMQRPIKDFLSLFRFIFSEICLELKRAQENHPFIEAVDKKDQNLFSDLLEKYIDLQTQNLNMLYN